MTGLLFSVMQDMVAIAIIPRPQIEGGPWVWGMLEYPTMAA